ncbi:MAG: flagellar hook assembly protein FlgD [Microbacteriaceae bacterium]|nr:flagellar hook assembly protein FlgD [Burkholderiaceae bacterium]
MSTVTSSATTGIAGLPSSLTKPGSAATATTAQEASDRFLKLLVTQLQNQDPMNPMDNAQMTSQMAQISTVSGIEKLNLTVEGLNTQFVQMQALQGASLVGKDVILKGDMLSKINGDAVGTSQLDSAADRVKVEVLNAAGQLVDTLNLGAQTSGRHDFEWPAGAVRDDAASFRFRVSANSGATALAVTPLMRDKVDAVNTSGKSLTLELERSGHVAYSAITAID